MGGRVLRQERTLKGGARRMGAGCNGKGGPRRQGVIGKVGHGIGAGCNGEGGILLLRLGSRLALPIQVAF